MTVPSFLCEKLFPALYDPAATLVFGKRRLKKTDDTFKAQMLAHHMVRELMFWDRYSAYMSSIDVKSQTLIAYTSVVLVVISLFYTAAFPQDRFTDRVPRRGVALAVAVPSGQSRGWISLRLAG